MTREQRRSKSRYHNRMKREGYKWHKRAWWRPYRWSLAWSMTNSGVVVSDR